MAIKYELDISRQELQDTVVSALVEKLSGELSDDIEQRVQDEIRKKLQTQIEKKLDKLIMPLVKAKLDNLTIPQTNRYGEAKGDPMTFIEYATKSAENYMCEKVNYEGQTQNERNGYSWTGTQTRITHLVHQHLHYSIETAMKKALTDANSQIVKGIEETCKLKLAEISASMKVNVTHKS
jgi:hypothetical protein